jgi:hypothetical protein
MQISLGTCRIARGLHVVAAIMPHAMCSGKPR